MKARHSKKAPTRDYWLSAYISHVIFNSGFDQDTFDKAVESARRNAQRARFNSEQTAKLEDAILERIAYREAMGIK